MTEKSMNQKAQGILARAEIIVVLLLGLLYSIMAIFGRGTFWASFEKVNLYFILIAFPAAFILNSYLLMPLLLKKKKWLFYILSLFLIQLIFEYLRVFLNSDDTSAIFGKQNSAFSFTAGIGISWIVVSVRDWFINIREIERLKSEKLRSELDFLKVQVDPHFLFNTLNSIYSLALEENGPKTADSIIKLSALMRYNLHDSNEQLISIEKEVDYIEKYIALQKLRLNENTRFEIMIDFDRTKSNTAKITPLILIPFIENVFKYGVSTSKSTDINISILINDNGLILKTKNDIVDESAGSLEKGVGLKNVKNRLDLLYPKQYELSYGAESNSYYSYLKIRL